MKIILKFLMIFSFMLSGVNAEDFFDAHIISLKKDEQTKIFVKYASKKKILKFRWTLYKNGGLVIHRSYDRAVSQNILYLRNKNQNFRVDLISRGASFYNVPYLLVKFKEFDYEKNEAVFEVFLSDNRDQIMLEYLKNS